MASGDRWAPAQAVFRTAPLVLLNNFDDSKPELRLASVTLQNMFPSLAVATVKLADCQRCVLFSYDEETGLIHMRHYAIQTKASAASRSIRKVVKDRIPSLHHLDDISEFILGKGAAADGGATSESEAEVRLPPSAPPCCRRAPVTRSPSRRAPGRRRR